MKNYDLTLLGGEPIWLEVGNLFRSFEWLLHCLKDAATLWVMIHGCQEPINLHRKLQQALFADKNENKGCFIGLGFFSLLSLLAPYPLVLSKRQPLLNSNVFFPHATDIEGVYLTGWRESQEIVLPLAKQAHAKHYWEKSY